MAFLAQFLSFLVSAVSGKGESDNATSGNFSFDKTEEAKISVIVAEAIATLTKSSSNVAFTLSKTNLAKVLLKNEDGTICWASNDSQGFLGQSIKLVDEHNASSIAHYKMCLQMCEAVLMTSNRFVNCIVCLCASSDFVNLSIPVNGKFICLPTLSFQSWFEEKMKFRPQHST